MMHSILENAVFAVMVLAPCVLAMLNPAKAPDNSEPNVLEEGFI